MIVCDKCGKPLLLEYISVSFSAHKYMRKDLYSENFN